MSMLARLSFIGLITLADDHGLGRATPAFLMSRLHPYAPDVSGELFFQALAEIEAAKLAFFYKSDGCSYYVLPGWYEHQRVDHPSKTALPAPPPEILASIQEYSRVFREQYREEGKGEEGRGEEGKGKKKAATPAAVLIPLDLREWEESIRRWLAYKKEKGQGYKGEKGLEALWRAILKIPAEKRAEAIDHSMAMNWAGIYEKKSSSDGKVGGSVAAKDKYERVSRSR